MLFQVIFPVDLSRTFLYNQRYTGVSAIRTGREGEWEGGEWASFGWMSMQCARVDWLESFCPSSSLLSTLEVVGKENKHEANADCCLLIHMCKKALTFSSTCVCVCVYVWFYIFIWTFVCVCVCVCYTPTCKNASSLSGFLCAETTNCRVGRFRWGTTKKKTIKRNHNVLEL